MKKEINIHFILIWIFSIGSIILLQFYWEKFGVLKEYFEFQKACASYFDWGGMNYYECPELFLEYGVNEPLYRLFSWWVLFEPSLSIDFIKSITYDNSGIIAFSNGIVEALRLFVSFILSDIRSGNFGVVFHFIIYSILGFGTLFTVKEISEKFTIFLTVILNVMLIMYLCMLGRINSRSVYVCTYIPIAIFLYYFLKCIRQKTNIVFIICLLSVFSLSIIFIKCSYDSRILHKKQTITQANEMYDIALNNPENIYLTYPDLALSNNPYMDNEKIKNANNIIMIGSSYYGLPAFKEQLKQNGITSYSSDILLHNNVYLFTWFGDNAEAICDYLNTKYSNVMKDMIWADEKHYLHIYKFSIKEDS